MYTWETTESSLPSSIFMPTTYAAISSDRTRGRFSGQQTRAPGHTGLPSTPQLPSRTTTSTLSKARRDTLPYRTHNPSLGVGGEPKYSAPERRGKEHMYVPGTAKMRRLSLASDGSLSRSPMPEQLLWHGSFAFSQLRFASLQAWPASVGDTARVEHDIPDAFPAPVEPSDQSWWTDAAVRDRADCMSGLPGCSPGGVGAVGERLRSDRCSGKLLASRVRRASTSTETSVTTQARCRASFQRGALDEKEFPAVQFRVLSAGTSHFCTLLRSRISKSATRHR